ncbi:hypothetical protein AMECASPLE_020954, partial [Ameca splendens]
KKKKKKRFKEEKRQKQTKKTADSLSLPSSSWVLVIPYCSSRVRRSPQPPPPSPQDASGRVGGSSEWERRAGWRPAERTRLLNRPHASPFSQSPEPVLVEVSTEDGTNVSSEPTTQGETGAT